MYALDPAAAKKADQTGNRLTEIGKYVGAITQAEDITAGTGTKGIALRFEVNGQSANLSLYTMKTDGTKIMGHQVLMAMMTCLGLRNIEPKAGKVKRWDSTAKVEVTEDAQVFPDLCGKPLGLLLETEGYWKADASEGKRMVIAGVFQAKTELTATEILDRKTAPELLPKMVARLHHRPARGTPAAPRASTAPSGGSGFDDMDDDVPFMDPLKRCGVHLAI